MYEIVSTAIPFRTAPVIVGDTVLGLSITAGSHAYPYCGVCFENQYAATTFGLGDCVATQDGKACIQKMIQQRLDAGWLRHLLEQLVLSQVRQGLVQNTCACMLYWDPELCHFYWCTVEVGQMLTDQSQVAFVLGRRVGRKRSEYALQHRAGGAMSLDAATAEGDVLCVALGGLATLDEQGWDDLFRQTVIDRRHPQLDPCRTSLADRLLMLAGHLGPSTVFTLYRQA